MKHVVLGLLFSLSFCLYSQTVEDTFTVDEHYLEDQFYMGLTYNFLLGQPNGVSQRNLSYGLQAGFIKDIPLNQKRTVALGIGLGLALNTYYSNIRASEALNGVEYRIITEDLKRSKLETHAIEMPIEFRLRNSTPEDYKFWRVYAGVRLAYGLGARSKYIADEVRESFKNTDVRQFSYGLTLNFGWNTFNIHGYYSLTGLFNDGVMVNGEGITMKPLRIGFIFYIL